MLAVVHGESQVGEVAREWIRTAIVADGDLDALSEELAEASPGQLLITLLDIVIARLSAPR